jgi:hypothetical protein
LPAVGTFGVTHDDHELLRQSRARKQQNKTQKTGDDSAA